MLINMSENTTPSIKTDRQQRLLAHLTSKHRVSSLSPSPSSRSNQTVTSSTAQIINSSSDQIVSSSTAPTEPISNNLLPADPVSLSSPQTTSTFSSNHNLLYDVLKRLSNDNRAIIQNYIFHNVNNIDLTLEQILIVVNEKQQCCIEKKWTLTFKKRTVDVKKKTDKLIDWLNRFKAIEDIVVNVDLMHVSLSWTVIRLLLEINRNIKSIKNKQNI